MVIYFDDLRFLFQKMPLFLKVFFSLFKVFVKFSYLYVETCCLPAGISWYEQGDSIIPIELDAQQ